MNRVSTLHAWAAITGSSPSDNRKTHTPHRSSLPFIVTVHRYRSSFARDRRLAVLIAKSVLLANQVCRVHALDQRFSAIKTSPNTLRYTESAKKAKRGRRGIAIPPPF